MHPDRQGSQPPVYDNDRSAPTIDFASSRPVRRASRTFGEVAQALNLGEQDTTEWIQVPESARITNEERSEDERIEISRPTRVTHEERSENERMRTPLFTWTTNQARRESERTQTSSFTQNRNQARSESQRIHIPTPTQGANTDRSEFEETQIARSIRNTNQGRSGSPPVMVAIFTWGTNERRNEHERARFLDPRLDQLGQRGHHIRQHADEGSHESRCNVFQQLIRNMESIFWYFIYRFIQLPNEDLFVYQVLFLISLQLLVMDVLTMICIEKDHIGDSVVRSHKWVLGLSFSMCFSVVIARICSNKGFSLRPISFLMFLIWSVGVILTVSWITILLSFDFLALVIIFLWLWTASILVSGFVFAQPLLSYCNVLMPLFVVAGSAVLFITVGSKSIMSVSFASFVSMLFLTYLLRRSVHFSQHSDDCSGLDDVFCVATSIIL